MSDKKLTATQINKKHGRNPRYKYYTHVQPELDRIPKLKKQGYHDDQIAKLLGVAMSTFSEYKNDHPELADALKKGREHLIEDLEDTLYRKALGLVKIKETKKYIKKNKNGNEETRIEEIEKELPPDTAALIFSLKNLAPDNWKDDTRNDREKEMDENKHIVESIGILIDNIKNEGDKK